MHEMFKVYNVFKMLKINTVSSFAIIALYVTNFLIHGMGEVSYFLKMAICYR